MKNIEVSLSLSLGYFLYLHTETKGDVKSNQSIELRLLVLLVLRQYKNGI